jgi:hypothetical protein
MATVFSDIGRVANQGFQLVGPPLGTAVKVFVVEPKLSTEFVGTTVNFF